MSLLVSLSENNDQMWFFRKALTRGMWTLYIQNLVLDTSSKCIQFSHLNGFSLGHLFTPSTLECKQFCYRPEFLAFLNQ